jgi:hypothetical protein
MSFVLQVVEFKGGEKLTNRHVGYMNIIFRTKKEACQYYDRRNPNMRKINYHGTYKSDWDPETRLFYVVCANHGYELTIDTFSV